MSLTHKALRFLRYPVIGKRNFHLSPSLCEFWIRDEKGGYSGKHEELPPLTKRIPQGFKELKEEIELYKKELYEDFFWLNTPLIVRPGEIDIIWKFGKESSLDTWVTSSDSDHNEGFSKCELMLTKDGNGLFSGELNKRVPKDGKIARAGYCNMKTKTFRKSFKRQKYLDWTAYNVLNMKVRGDGRSYFLNIGNKGYFDLSWNDMYHYPLYTRGGPYWQIVRIPFSKFFLSSRGRIQDKQFAIDLSKISSFSITMADKVDGPFSLEIEYIGLENDPYHRESFAYEMYQLDGNIAAS
ncbi:complex I intermediate-associated protein 30, mitochondrial [Coccinella septempunctata]|uniref:complex I intermediate-associated protein 30, mitochondrial n=1 Tax=Coccinella septempunctata TaxID=41139 RepID=UPI001D084897|nr:complex I intermediate-associated protein 30, mitochondrial [Coccinella septempunctata]